jgi:hypothetical protein
MPCCVLGRTWLGCGPFACACAATRARRAWPDARPRACRAGDSSHDFQSPSRRALVVWDVRCPVLYGNHVSDVTKGVWACESVREFVELQKVLRFFRGIIVRSIGCAQVRDILVLVGHCHTSRVALGVMSRSFGGEDLEIVKLRQGSMTPAAALCASGSTSAASRLVYGCLIITRATPTSSRRLSSLAIVIQKLYQVVMSSSTAAL